MHEFLYLEENVVHNSFISRILFLATAWTLYTATSTVWDFSHVQAGEQGKNRSCEERMILIF